MLAAIKLLSDATIAQLAKSGWAPLRHLPNGDEGRILLMDAHRLDQFMPPRISMMPAKSKFSGRNNTRGPVRVSQNTNGYDAESRMAISAKAIHQDEMTFEVRCWGWASDREDDLDGRDWDYTIALRDAVIAAANEIMSGGYAIDNGEWRVASHNARVGREFVFHLTINFAITESPLPPATSAGTSSAAALRFAPDGTHIKPSDQMTIGTGASSPGCEG